MRREKGGEKNKERTRGGERKPLRSLKIPKSFKNIKEKNQIFPYFLASLMANMTSSGSTSPIEKSDLIAEDGEKVTCLLNWLFCG